MSEQLPQPSAGQAKSIAEFEAWMGRHIGAGAISFAEFMQLALNKPGYGYYRRDVSPISAAHDGGDFTTASELTPLYAASIANDFALVLQQCAHPVILELGAGSGAFAYACLQRLHSLNCLPEKYYILETSAARIAEQKSKLSDLANNLGVDLVWLSSLDAVSFEGVVVANEILDVLPVEIFRVTKTGFEMLFIEFEAGLQERWAAPTAQMLTALGELQHKLGCKLPQGMRSEICLCLPAWLNSLAQVLQKGLLFFADYGHEREVYYHAQRLQGTLHCHFKHHAHYDPFIYLGQQDITAHVDFSQVGDVLCDAGLECLGLPTQAEYLLQAGILDLLEQVTDSDYLNQSQTVKKLLHPNFMGDVFKVMAFFKNIDIDLPGFE
jgi:SAM-dependent MidA family methyltransferase